MRVDILIPCFNCEKWVGQAIQSALDQTHPDKRIFVFDDGSTDRSLDVIRAFGDQIVCESHGNQGVNATRNQLLRTATGEWVQFLDADDYLLPTKIANQLACWDQSGKDADVIFSPFRIITMNPDGSKSFTDTTVDRARALEEEWINWKVAQTGTMLWTRSALVDLGGWNEANLCCHDNELTMRAIIKGVRFLLTDSAEAVFRVWSEQTVSRGNPNQAIHVRKQLTEQMVDWLRSSCRLTPAVQLAAGQAAFEMSQALAAGDLSQTDNS